jgi:hypothetical protein
VLSHIEHPHSLDTALGRARPRAYSAETTLVAPGRGGPHTVDKMQLVGR